MESPSSSKDGECKSGEFCKGKFPFFVFAMNCVARGKKEYEICVAKRNKTLAKEGAITLRKKLSQNRFVIPYELFLIFKKNEKLNFKKNLVFLYRNFEYASLEYRLRKFIDIKTSTKTIL